jgi:A/G-specific adenine glycosylase
VASIAYGVPVAAVDTNVARVVARARLGTEPHHLAGKALQEAAAGWLDPTEPGAWNQALMDLGREICRPVPRCAECPVSGDCHYRPRGGVGGHRRRTQEPFEGTLRRVRGAIVRTLRDRPSISVAKLSEGTGEPRERLAEAIRGLVRDGLAEASRGALQGLARGRVRLPAD